MTTRLGDVQLAIMRELWSRGEATVAEVHAALKRERGLAPTTIATMLSKMETKGVVAHRQDGRRFVYRPTVSQDAVTRTMVAHITDNLFAGEPAALVSHLIAKHEISAEELAELNALIARATQEEGGG